MTTEIGNFYKALREASEKMIKSEKDWHRGKITREEYLAIRSEAKKAFKAYNDAFKEAQQ